MTLAALQAKFPRASKAFIQRNRKLLEGVPADFMATARPVASSMMSELHEYDESLPPAPVKRLRQSTKPLMNKLEGEYYTRLCVLYGPKVPIRAQAKTYRLANGVRYTPDLTAVVLGVEQAWEVKGRHAWDDALVKLKVAAACWPEVRFTLAWKSAAGEWCSQEVKP